MTRTLIIATGIAFAALAANVAPCFAAANDSDQERQERWANLQKQIFGEKKLATDDKAVSLDVAKRAEDASLVPVGISIADPKNVKALYLVIDDNPSPVAAHFTFGPDSDPKDIKLRVRVNAYTLMHAVVETKDGKFIESAKFVKAAGGCSAPMGVSDEEAMRGMGDMKFKVAGDVQPNKPVEAMLMVRHPNFNGMQMNQQTREYTPARYIQTLNVTFDDKEVFKLETDISLASNPVITFAMLPNAGKGTVKVDVRDSQNGQWSKSFNVPTVSN